MVSTPPRLWGMQEHSMLAAIQVTYAMAMGHHPNIDLDATPVTHEGRTSVWARLSAILAALQGIHVLRRSHGRPRCYSVSGQRALPPYWLR